MPQPTDTSRAMRETSVNVWISDNAAKLKQRLNLYNNLDEDAFQDAYLTLVKEYPNPEPCTLLEATFLKAYRRFSKLNIGESFTLSHPDELFFTLLPSDKAEPMEKQEDTTDPAPLAKRVQRHIRASFPRKDVMAFEMKIKGFSCRDIADAIGLGTAAINKATERIITQTRLQFSAIAL